MAPMAATRRETAPRPAIASLAPHPAGTTARVRLVALRRAALARRVPAPTATPIAPVGRALARPPDVAATHARTRASSAPIVSRTPATARNARTDPIVSRTPATGRVPAARVLLVRVRRATAPIAVVVPPVALVRRTVTVVRMVVRMVVRIVVAVPPAAARIVVAVRPEVAPTADPIECRRGASASR